MEQKIPTLDSQQQRSLTHCFSNHPGHILEQLDLQRHHGAFTDITVRIISDATDAATAATDFKLHRCVLCAASNKLQLLVFAMITNATDLLTLRDVTVPGFRCIIGYIYTGVLKVDRSNVEDVVIAARVLEIAEVEKVAVELARKLGNETSMAPPTEAALSLMRMSQGIGLGKASDPAATSQLAFLSTSQQRAPWVGKAKGFSQEGASSSSYESTPTQQAGNPTTTSQAVVVLPANQGTYVTSAPVKTQSLEDSGCEEEQKGRPSTLLPLAILSPDGHSAVQILNTPSATTTVTSTGNLQDELQEDAALTTADDKEAEDGAEGDNPVKSEEGTEEEGTVCGEEDMDVSTNSDSTANASKEIAIQTSIASYTVRMKRNKHVVASAATMVAKGRSKCKAGVKARVKRRPRGRPRKSQSQVPEMPSPASSKPLKKRLREQSKDEKATVAAADIKPKPEKRMPKKETKHSKSKSSSTDEKKVHVCSKCSRPFGKKGAMLRHVQMHEKGQMFACNVCGYSYPRSSELTQHERKHVTHKWVCGECGMEFEDPRLFKKHRMMLHRDARPFRCQFEGCTFRSGRPSNVDKHAVIHSGVKSYTCQQCGKCFAQPNGLQSHLKSCYQKRNYICDLCGQRFNYLQSMKSHRLLHTGEKPHECVYCGARFADHRNFKRHKRVHETGGKPGQPGKQRVRNPPLQMVGTNSVKKKLQQQQQQQQQQAIQPVKSMMLPVTSSMMSPMMTSQSTVVRTVTNTETNSGTVSTNDTTNSLLPVTNNIILQPANSGVPHQILNSVGQATLTVAPQHALHFRLEPMNVGTAQVINSEQVVSNAQYIEAIPVSVAAEAHAITVAQPGHVASSQAEFIQVPQSMTTWSQLPFTVTRTFDNL